jgi:hypothetical protein
MDRSIGHSMDQCLQAIGRLATLSRVVQAEQAIQTALLQVPVLIPDSDDNARKALEPLLIGLLHINAGLLTAQCSTVIGRCLYLLYLLDPNAKFYGLRADATDHPTAANIFALRYVVRKIGSTARNSLVTVTTRLLRVKDSKLDFAVLLALRTLFKACGSQVLSKYASDALNFLRARFAGSPECVQIAAVRLAEVLLGYDAVQHKQVVSFADTAFEQAHSHFVRSSIAQLVSRYTASLICGEEGRGNLSEAFALIDQFPAHFSLVFPRFLDFVNPVFLHNHVKQFFAFARRKSLVEVVKLTAFFGKNIRSVIFNDLFASKELHLLKLLIFDEESARQTGGIAAEQICSSVPSERQAASTFFGSLALTFPGVAAEYLQAALQFLANPPNTMEGGTLQYEGMASVAAIILSATPNSQELSPRLVKCLNSFLELSLDPGLTSQSSLVPVFMVMAPLNRRLLAALLFRVIVATGSLYIVSRCADTADECGA